MENQIEIFTAIDGTTQVEVRFEGDTFWLSQEQLSILFERDQSVISRHISTIFKNGELIREGNMQKMHIPNSDKPISLFNLDVIISVGYRVNSIRGTQFRQWATKRLKDYLIEGVAINEKRLEQKNKEIQVLHDGIRILSRAIEDQVNQNNEYQWLQQFSLGLQLLDDYDHESLDTTGLHTGNAEHPLMNEYTALVNEMRSAFDSGIFGVQKDGGFISAVQQIKQGFGDSDIYPSLEEKAAMLLYLIIKNHAFIDGNKRIAAACFLLFLERNRLLFSENGKPIISNEALASLTLFVASSQASEMETVKKLLISVLNRSVR
jgi:prophage maintenance system killer protein